MVALSEEEGLVIEVGEFFVGVDGNGFDEFPDVLGAQGVVSAQLLVFG